MTKLNFNKIFTTLFFLNFLLPILYFQQDFLLSFNPVFLDSLILTISTLLFLIISVYFIQTRNNLITYAVFVFLIVIYVFLTINLQGSINKNVFLGSCRGQNIYKKSQFTLGQTMQNGNSYSYFSSDWNMSIVKSQGFSQGFGLQKVAILGIKEDWLTQSNLIKYKYNDQKFLQEIDTWTIFQRPHSTARSADFEDEYSLKNLDKSEFANCPELTYFIEKQYNIILTSQTLQKIKAEYPVQQADPRKFRKS